MFCRFLDFHRYIEPFDHVWNNNETPNFSQLNTGACLHDQIGGENSRIDYTPIGPCEDLSTYRDNVNTAINDTGTYFALP